MKFKITKYGLTFSKGKGELTIHIEPSHRVCEICNDDGLCKNNENHKDYEKNNEDCWLGTDLYDCVEYTEKKEGIKVGIWMREWGKRLQKKNDNQCKGGFREWSESVRKNVS